MTKKKAEFDKFAEGYSGGGDNPIKRLFGADLSGFLGVKVNWFLEHVGDLTASLDKAEEELRLLDFGCGNGELLKLLKGAGFKGRLSGCDVSPEMIREGRKEGGAAQELELFEISDGDTEISGAPYDLIVACCVLHHIDPAKLVDNVIKIRQNLSPNGTLIVFEHNPYNPLTQLIVRTTPIDEHAHLVTSRRLRRIMKEIRFTAIRQQNILFFPPFLENMFHRPIHKYLGWLPLGGQYVMTGHNA